MREACPPGQATVDHDANAFDRQRGLCDVGREDDLAFRAWQDGAVLLFAREIPVERNDTELLSSGQSYESVSRASDLGLARKEDQDVSLVFCDDALGRACHRVFEAARTVGSVLDRDGEHATLHAQARSVTEIGRDLLGVECG